MNIASSIAKIGTNDTFIAFNAHCWFAFAVVSFYPHPITYIVGLVLALLKEFWFDAKYEVPKQTFLTNLTDFCGYAAGLAIGLFWYKIHM